MYALHTETQEHIQIIKVDDELKYLDYYSRYNEKLVLYKSLYDDAIPYVRPYDMFMSEVDKEKYPNVEQKYRLELVRYQEGKYEEKLQSQYRLIPRFGIAENKVIRNVFENKKLLVVK